MYKKLLKTKIKIKNKNKQLKQNEGISNKLKHKNLSKLTYLYKNVYFNSETHFYLPEEGKFKRKYLSM